MHELLGLLKNKKDSELMHYPICNDENMFIYYFLYFHIYTHTAAVHQYMVQVHGYNFTSELQTVLECFNNSDAIICLSWVQLIGFISSFPSISRPANYKYKK